MSIAPSWCGTIMATKSASTSPDGLTFMADIIFAMAALFSDMNFASRLPAREVTPPIRTTTNGADHIHQRECAKRYILNPLTNSKPKATTKLMCACGPDELHGRVTLV